MKISRFRSLGMWFALIACSSSSLTTHAGDLARARAKLTAPPSQASTGATTMVSVEQPIVETAARPRYLLGSPQQSSTATRYSAPTPATGKPTLAPPQPTTTSPAQPFVVTPVPTNSPTPTFTSPAPLPALKQELSVPATSAPAEPLPGIATPTPRVAPAYSNPLTGGDAATSSRRDEVKRTYHNALRAESEAPATATTTKEPPVEASAPAAIISPSTLAEAAGRAAVARIEDTPATPNATAARPVDEKLSAAVGSVAPSTTAPTTTTSSAPKTGTTTSAPNSGAAAPVATAPSTATPKPAAAAPAPVGRATDAAPIRKADPSQPGRLPPLAGEREPGEPDHEQRMTIGRTPADEQTKQMFESKEMRPLTPELELLKKRVQTALALYYKNWTLNTQEHSPWEVMHAIVAYGVDTKLRTNGGRETTTAIGHLCYSGICRNQPILTIRNGELYALRGPGVQGHPGQFLAILAQSYLQRDYPLYVGGEKYTLEDLIKAEMHDCEAGTELTFKLISLMHYLPSDATWTNFQGQKWSLDRLVREEIVQPVRGAACGGTHRLMGLSYAIRKREQRGEPIDGIYLEAKKYIDQYHKYTFSLQNPDGSFSTAWFVRKEARNDVDRRMQTSGHILEWLAFSLSDEQLRDPRVVKAVKYVTDLLLNEHYTQWEVGHLGHGLHALQIYNERVFGGEVRSFEGLVSRKPAATARVPAPAAR